MNGDAEKMIAFFYRCLFCNRLFEYGERQINEPNLTEHGLALWKPRVLVQEVQHECQDTGKGCAVFVGCRLVNKGAL